MYINLNKAKIYNLLIAKLKKLYSKDKMSVIGGFVCVLLLIGLWLIPGTEKKVDEATKEVLLLADNVRKYYQTKPSYWGLSTESAIADGIIPENMIKKGRAINALGTNVLLGTAPNGEPIMPGMMGFDIIYQEIPKNLCIELATYQFSSQQNLGLKAISIVNDNAVTFSWGSKNALPINIEQAAKFCKGKSSIIWNFE